MKGKGRERDGNGLPEGLEELEELDENAIHQEVEQFNRDKDKIRGVLKSIGSAKGASMNRLVDGGFILALGVLFVARFVFNWVDNILSLELGLLLISVKILWLIKVQSNYNHFIFMIMHTIESHQTFIIEKLDRLEAGLGKGGDGTGTRGQE